MKPEYVKLHKPELVFGEINLLESQLNTLLLKKQYHAYQILRKQELLCKIELKNATNAMREHLEVLDKLLPHTRYIEEKKEEKKLKQEVLDRIELAVEEAAGNEPKRWKDKMQKAKGKAGKEKLPKPKLPMGTTKTIEDELASIRARIAAIK